MGSRHCRANRIQLLGRTRGWTRLNPEGPGQGRTREVRLTQSDIAARRLAKMIGFALALCHLLVAMALSADASALGVASSSSEEDSTGASSGTPHTGMLVWKGHWFAGDVGLWSTYRPGDYLILADSLDGRLLPENFWTVRLRASEVVFDPPPADFADFSPRADTLARTWARLEVFKRRASALHRGMSARRAALGKVADSLSALARTFTDVLDSVQATPSGCVEFRRGEHAPWGVDFWRGQRPKADPNALIVVRRSGSVLESIKEQLRAGRTVIVTGVNPFVVVPEHLLEGVREQLAALRAHRAPTVAVLSDSTAIRQLLSPEPLEPGAR